MNILFVDVPTEQLQLVVDLAKQHLYKYTPVLPIDLGDCFQKHVLVNESASIEICSGTDLLFIKWIPDVS